MYRWPLRPYPASFRNEYGREMATVFARERRDTPTALGMAALWLRVIADTCVTAAGIHWDILTRTWAIRCGRCAAHPRLP